MFRQRSLSFAQSSVDGLQPSGHRLDLLIAEQKTLVRSTQESLKQALGKYESSSSKEEQESARIQVESLLTRAQELAITVQVILHIRLEIGYIQQEIRTAKANHEPTSKLHGRLQWLEQHLEKLLMIRRRGRPGPRAGRRALGGGLPRAGIPGRGGIGRIIEREAVSIGTASRGDNLSDFDGISQQGSPWKSESTATSNYHNIHSQSPSSKQTASRDSDDWHSESEANWTMYQTKDITQSQVLSEDEQNQSRLTSTPSWSKTISPAPQQQDKTVLPQITKNLASESGSEASEVYKFEPRRPVEVFGNCSWNSLSLAKSSNLVKTNTTVSNDLHGLSMAVLHAGVSDLDKDIEALKKVIADAGQAASSSGPLVSTSKATVHFQLNSRERSLSRRLSRMEEKQCPGNGSLASLESISSACSKMSPSRRHYGQQGKHERSSTYPRMTGVWCETRKTEGNKPLMSSFNHDGGMAARLRRISRIKSQTPRASKGAQTPGLDDIFNRDKHQLISIEHLIQQTQSPIDDVRKNSVQSLGMLQCADSPRLHLEERLLQIMLHDRLPLIQYEAFKSMVLQGCFTDEVVQFARNCLRGPIEVATDLLSFLSQDHVVELLSEKGLIDHLAEELTCFLEYEDEQLSFPAAVLLCRAQTPSEDCMRVLKQNLKSKHMNNQSLALSCLVQACECHDEVVITAASTKSSGLPNTNRQ